MIAITKRIFSNSYTLVVWDNIPFHCAPNKDWIKSEITVEDNSNVLWDPSCNAKDLVMKLYVYGLT